MGDYVIERVDDPSDPDRCQQMTAQGQCMNRALPDATNCAAHGGNKQAAGVRNQVLQNYKLREISIRQSVIEKANSTGIKSLREEIGLARLVLENIVNKCEDATDLLINQNQIERMIAQIEKLVSSAHKLETSLGMTLDKAAILRLASGFVEVITDEVTNLADLDEKRSVALITAISDRLFDIIKDVG